MGRVYKARQQSLARVVALKVLNPELALDEELAERFLREARAGAKLSHPNAVRMLDQGTCKTSGTHYIAFEFIDGSNLEELVQKHGTLPERIALSIAQGTAAALCAAEEEQIVHRDIKPENVLVTREGHAKLLDLGLAKRMGEAGLTMVGAVLGSPHYVAPEQVLGLDELDIRADLYALGLTLYRGLTAEFPFPGKEFIAIATRHVNEDLPDPRELNEQVSGHTAQLLRWLSARDPEERYPTARAAHLDLARVLDGQEPLGPAAAGAEAASNQRLAKQDALADVAAFVAGRWVKRGDKARAPATLADSERAPFTLRLMTGDVVLQERRFDQDVVTIGRGRGSHFHIDNPIVSRQHAELRRRKDSFALAPKSRTNPTSVNGLRVRDLIPVKPGDEILLADKFQLEIIAETPKPKPKPKPDVDSNAKTEARRLPADEEDDVVVTPQQGEEASAQRDAMDFDPYAQTPEGGFPVPGRETAPEVVDEDDENPYTQPTILPDDVDDDVDDDDVDDENPYTQPTVLPDDVDDEADPFTQPTVIEDDEDAIATDVGTVQGEVDEVETVRDPGRARTRAYTEPVEQTEAPGLAERPTARLRAEQPTQAIKRSLIAAPRAQVSYALNGKQETLPVLATSPLQIGKARPCEIKTPGAFAPRKAALIAACGPVYRVFNVGPSPDTVSLNGSPVEDQAELSPGDTLVVYGVELTFALDG
jgi:pSer/pThr/pTyr-binding forkhead associated (FHA) protein